MKFESSGSYGSGDIAFTSRDADAGADACTQNQYIPRNFFGGYNNFDQDPPNNVAELI